MWEDGERLRQIGVGWRDRMRYQMKTTTLCLKKVVSKKSEVHGKALILVTC